MGYNVNSDATPIKLYSNQANTVYFGFGGVAFRFSCDTSCSIEWAQNLHTWPPTMPTTGLFEINGSDLIVYELWIESYAGGTDVTLIPIGKDVTIVKNPLIRVPGGR